MCLCGFNNALFLNQIIFLSNFTGLDFSVEITQMLHTCVSSAGVEQSVGVGDKLELSV